MVGLLSSMDDEDRSSASVAQTDKDVGVSAAQAEESMARKSPADEGQPAAENSDTVDEVEHVKELKSILKQRGQYTFRKVKVDFDLIPKKIPYDEDDYTVEIQIVEKEPIKIKSWAALFAAKKAEAEAEAAAIAEAEEALKKAEEVQKREALKKANKAKSKKEDDHSKSNQETDASLSAEPNEKGTEGRRVEYIEPEPSRQFTNESVPTEHDGHEEPEDKSDEQVEKNYDDQTEGQSTTQSEEPCEDYQQAESIAKEVVDTLLLTEDLLSNVNPQRKDAESVSEQKDEEISCSESLEAERSERLQQDNTNDDLEDISNHEETSVSQLIDDSKTEESLSQALTRSESEEKLSYDDASQGEDNSLKTSQSDDGSKSIELQGKKNPKKVLETASSLVEEILSEMPVIIQTVPQDPHGEEPIPISNENDGTATEKPQEKCVTLESLDIKSAKGTNLKM